MMDAELLLATLERISKLEIIIKELCDWLYTYKQLDCEIWEKAMCL